MTFDLSQIVQSKREFRERAAAWPIVEKLAMLDALRERAIAIGLARAKFHPSRDQFPSRDQLGHGSSNKAKGE